MFESFILEYIYPQYSDLFKMAVDYVSETRSSRTIGFSIFRNFSKILSRISRSLCENLDNGSWLAARDVLSGAVPNFRGGNAHTGIQRMSRFVPRFLVHR